jgi:hypothetical protein
MITSMGDAVMFYQFGDGKDNDGDGCIDEEFMDDVDNDMDGFVDEDARVFRNPLAECLDNDRNGTGGAASKPCPTLTVDPGEDTVGVAVNANFPRRLGFVHAFLAANPDSVWIKIPRKLPDGSSNPEMNLRIAIQRDSLATKTKAQLEGPLKNKLDSAKMLMGGCWRNYPTHVP